MSKMSQIHFEIQERLEQDEDPKKIASEMGVSLTWVYAVQEFSTMQENECYSPYQTINS
jgi:hypothetical protein